MPTMVVALAIFFASALLHSSSVRAAKPTPPEKPLVDFARDVRPILSNACFHCHGPDEGHREAGLRLDLREAAVGDLGGYAAIVPGDPAASHLISRIFDSDADLVMPPPDSGKALDASERELLRRWIEQGAAYSEHWAFTPPHKSLPPEPDDGTWARGAIDRFVLDRLESSGLSPSPPADRTTLLRRLSLDLIGLPPTIEEVDDFLADRSPWAYEAVVNRLLNSVHYGERWGRIWLDAARYADSDGFEKDKPRFVWFYRDWVVRALNADMPYNQFVIKQIAGDLLPDATQDDRIATGFLRNSMINEEGGADPEQFRMEAIYDRMDAIGKAVLGLTVQCAQCHSHKYDPLSHVDYYRMLAFLNNSHEANLTVYTPLQQDKRASVNQRIERVLEEFKSEVPDWAELLAEWQQLHPPETSTQWTPVEIAFIDHTIGGQKFLRQSDGSYLAQGYAPTRFTPTGNVSLVSPRRITAVRIDAMVDPNLPHGGPGRSIDGTWALSEIELLTKLGEKWEPRSFSRAIATVDPPRRALDSRYDDKSKTPRFVGGSSLAIDGDRKTAWHADLGPGRRNDPQTAMFVLADPIEATAGQPLTFRIGLSQHHGGWNSDDNQTHNLGRFKVSVSGDDHPSIDEIPPAIRRIMGMDDALRTPAQRASLLSYWISCQPLWKSYTEQIEAAWKDHPEGHSQLTLWERDDLRTTHRLDRGDFLSPLETVDRGTPSFLHPMLPSASGESASQPTRLDFAHWLVASESPTTARAIVNRVWQEHFGTGLTATSDDLGLQGEPPSHPELLDWLAVDFMQRGWSLKQLHRQIVMSAAYQQASRLTPESLDRDPSNRLLARGPRGRVAAEVVRDIALSASHLLNPAVGGRPVFPPAPEFLFQPPASYGPKTWNHDTDGNQFRRGLYTFRFRSVPYPVFQAFDAPNGDVACVRRSQSNTPLQALVTLNEPMFLQCARELARTTADVADDSDRITAIFRRCVARPPSADERQVLFHWLAQQRSRFAENPSAAAIVSATSDEIHAVEPAVWTALSRVILNLDETITKE